MAEQCDDERRKRRMMAVCGRDEDDKLSEAVQVVCAVNGDAAAARIVLSKMGDPRAKTLFKALAAPVVGAIPSKFVHATCVSSTGRAELLQGSMIALQTDDPAVTLSMGRVLGTMALCREVLDEEMHAALTVYVACDPTAELLTTTIMLYSKPSMTYMFVGTLLGFAASQGCAKTLQCALAHGARLDQLSAANLLYGASLEKFVVGCGKVTIPLDDAFHTVPWMTPLQLAALGLHTACVQVLIAAAYMAFSNADEYVSALAALPQLVSTRTPDSELLQRHDCVWLCELDGEKPSVAVPWSIGTARKRVAAAGDTDDDVFVHWLSVDGAMTGNCLHCLGFGLTDVSSASHIASMLVLAGNAHLLDGLNHCGEKPLQCHKTFPGKMAVGYHRLLATLLRYSKPGKDVSRIKVRQCGTDKVFLLSLDSGRAKGVGDKQTRRGLME